VADSERRPLLTVAVLTYLRPELLEGLLPVVRDRAREVTDIDVEILVVDNDPAGSAGPVARRLSSGDLRYVNETTPGIAAARKRALAETVGSDLVLFLDDDVVPSPGWLPPLVRLWRQTGATAVLGHVDYVFDPGADPWVVQGGFFRRTTHPTGTIMPTAATGNLLLDRAQVARLGVDFDPRLGMSGGEDTLFSFQLADAGGTIVYCRESVVVGALPLARTDRVAARTRARAHGGIAVRVRLARAHGRRARVLVRCRAVLGGAARAVAGSAQIAVGLLTSDVRRRARGSRLRARGLGMAGAGLGRHIEEYVRTGR
jgi:glycosyltransferase involved in cell wall biosynthesis